MTALPRGAKWKDVPGDWACPVYISERIVIEKAEVQIESFAKPKPKAVQKHKLSRMPFGAMSALISNLAKGSEKLRRKAETEKFNELAQYYSSLIVPGQKEGFAEMSKIAGENLETDFPEANIIAKELSDRGALRALTWAEKVTRVVASTTNKYEKNGA